jgi:hypothetical protein
VSEAVYGPLITFVVTILFGWFLVEGFQSGTMQFPYFSGRRHDQPIRFWLTAVLIGLFTILGTLGTFLQIFYPDGLGS